MIVYNVERGWFPMKNDAEAYRKTLGLKPDANFKLVIETREELAAFLNGLMGIKAPEQAPAGAVVEPVVAPPEVIERNFVEVPDYVPMFLAKAYAKAEGKEIKWVASEEQPSPTPSTSS
ncbi:hypothetical protein [Mesorhizobium sp. WSM2239]|uniref:DUF1840 domain-containing protein n=2 Tax=unclassified Mesorhizobium TaxID=325217 RepID=A0AAU8DEV5_9HYPH